MASKGDDKQIVWLYMDNLQSRDIPEAKFPVGYNLHTWQDGCEEIWFNIVKESFGECFLESKTVETFKERYFSKPQFNKDGFFLVRHKNQYVATVFAWQDEDVTDIGRLHWLAVSQAHRGKGIGKALCLCILKFFQDHGKTNIAIKSERFREKAIQLYERLGFNKVLK